MNISTVWGNSVEFGGNVCVLVVSGVRVKKINMGLWWLVCCRNWIWGKSRACAITHPFRLLKWVFYLVIKLFSRSMHIRTWMEASRESNLVNENDYVHRMEMWFYWRHSFILSPHGFAHSLLLLYLYRIWLSPPVILYMHKTLWELLETYVTSLALTGRRTTIRLPSS